MNQRTRIETLAYNPPPSKTTTTIFHILLDNLPFTTRMEIPPLRTVPRIIFRRTTIFPTRLTMTCPHQSTIALLRLLTSYLEPQLRPLRLHLFPTKAASTLNVPLLNIRDRSIPDRSITFTFRVMSKCVGAMGWDVPLLREMRLKIARA